MRFVVQIRLCSALSELLVSANEDIGVRVRGYLREVVSACKFLVTRFSREYLTEVSRKRLTRDLRDIIFPTPLYRALYSEGLGQDVLNRVKRGVVLESTKTIFF